ncbi:unnamed protein product, partial [Iphiclides podalirius]
MSRLSCTTVKGKSWPYEQYYTGERDAEKIKCVKGENHWTGAKGLFYSNIRWGPGIESHVDVRQNVGLWLGNKLIRLAWKPPSHNLILDLMTTNAGRACVNAHRNLMETSSEAIDESNEVIELLIKYGSKAKSAKASWGKLYPKNLTDLTSPVFRHQLFDQNYYGSRNIDKLIEVEKMPERIQSFDNNKTYFAWNNNEIIKHMMKHAFIHGKQLENKINIGNILSESRKKLKQPAKHELDCRTLLMASYLGDTESVVHLVTNEDIHPDVTDLQGNSVLMYATCGDQTELIHFLVEAGASVNNFNDSCCTALGVALIRLICQVKGISVNDMAQAFTPETALSTDSSIQNVCEWNFGTDNNTLQNKNNGPTRSASKLLKSQVSHKRIKSLPSLKEQSLKTNPDTPGKVPDQGFVTGNDDLNESVQQYTIVKNKYTARVALDYSAAGNGSPISYVFEVGDVTNNIIDNEVEEQKKTPEKNPKKVTSKALKEQVNGKVKLTNGLRTQSKENPQELRDTEKIFTDSYERILLTINQLLLDGADPSLVRCPQPALFMAVTSGCSKLVKQLIDHGANVNEFYPHVLGYSVLDIAISYPLTNENLKVINVLLENGADTQHRLPYNNHNSNESMIPGPTLLHAVLAKTADSEIEEEIRRHLLELLLTHNCDSEEQFKGRSAIDVAMSKGADIFNVFIGHPKVNLNAIINQSNQNVLTKMFTLSYFKTLESKHRLEILTNLLRHGADPLQTCQNDEEKFYNIIVYAKKFLHGCENVEIKHSPIAARKQSENKIKKNGKSNDDKGAKQKTVIGDVDDYKQALELKLALKNEVPLHVCFCLIAKYLDASVRQFHFLIKGLEKVAAECKKLNISFHLLEGSGADALPQWIIDHKIGAVVCDFNPLRTPMSWVEGAKKKFKKDIPLIQVDTHNVVPCWVASDKQEYSARTIRNKINSKLDEYLTQFPPVIKHPYTSKFEPKPIDWDKAIETREADKTVGPVEWASPGYDEAVKTLKTFLEKRLKIFASKRNDPTQDALSNLSPWFHFGQISVQRVALCVQKYKKQYTESVNAYLEEAIVRSELADNFCFYCEHYDSIKGASNWAQKTLDDHRKDKRTHIYTLEELAKAETHDELWNSAQLQMVKEGKMHGFLRMYWCKKILEWTPSPEDALKYAIYLNDHYSIDGRDPNGYVGCMWSICGIHDQGWAERAVFGKVRYMNYEGCKRKFHVNAFVARYGGKKHKYIAKK